jgi:hypothetical protein
MQATPVSSIAGRRDAHMINTDWINRAPRQRQKLRHNFFWKLEFDRTRTIGKSRSNAASTRAGY